MQLDANESIPVLVGLALLVGALRSSVMAGGATALLRRPWASERRIYRLPLSPGQARSELQAAATVLVFDALLFALFTHSRVTHFAPATASTIALSFALMFVGYEVWFYVLHRALHTRLLFRLHAQHHTAHVAQPLSAFSFSLAERFLLHVGAIGLVALLSPWVPLTRAGLALYMVFNNLMNVAGHGNVELFPAGFARSSIGKVAITPTFHALHHARLNGHYGLFTRVLDATLHTEWTDYPALQERAASGQGAQRLGERVEAEQA